MLNLREPFLTQLSKFEIKVGKSLKDLELIIDLTKEYRNVRTHNSYYNSELLYEIMRIDKQKLSEQIIKFCNVVENNYWQIGKGNEFENEYKGLFTDKIIKEKNQKSCQNMIQ